MDATRIRLLRLTERASWTFGLVGLLWWGTFHVGAATATRQDLERFAVLRAASNAGAPDKSLSAPERLAVWPASLLESAPAPLAVLRIARIRLEVPVLPGTDARTLDRAVGAIEGTAPPGTGGNVGIAGHRDSHFRGLKDIHAGDLIEIDTPLESSSYRVERMWVVDPTEVSVLAPTPGPALTLVTCYPFDFIGSAPRRFIVRALPATRGRIVSDR
jgi:sortase A